MPNHAYEYVFTAALVALTLLLLNPFHFWMPTMAHMMVIGGMVASFGLLGAFVVREASTDERDTLHRMQAGRVAFLAGAAVLVIGIAAQSFKDAIDPWLVLALVAMVSVKVAVRIYGDRWL